MDDNFNPFQTSPEFTALVQAVICSASVKASPQTGELDDPIAAARAAALKQFSGLTDAERAAVLERLRAARGAK